MSDDSIVHLVVLGGPWPYHEIRAYWPDGTLCFKVAADPDLLKRSG